MKARRQMYDYNEMQTLEFTFEQGDSTLEVSEGHPVDEVWVGIVNDYGSASMVFAKDEFKRIITGLYNHFIDGLEVLEDDFE